MPLRRAPLLSRLSPWELPILPFLAPRVFKPWPKGFHKYTGHDFVQATASQAVAEKLSSNASRFGDLDDTGFVPARIPQWRGNPGALLGTIVDTFSGQDHHHEISCRGYSATNDSSLKSIIVQDSESNKKNNRLPIGDTANRATSEVKTYIPITQDSPSISSSESSWLAGFAKISWQFDPRLNGNRMPDDIQLLSDRRIGAGVVPVDNFVSASNFRAILGGWPDLSLDAKEAIWPQIMLQALKKCPASALKFLVATSSRPYPPNYAISDSLEHIICYYLHEVQNPDPQDVHTIFHVVLRLLDQIEWGYFHMTQKTIYWLLINLEGDDAWKFYSKLKQICHPLNENTLLHFMATFARLGRTRFAVDVLQEIHRTGADFTQLKFESGCATLLQRKHQGGSESIISDSEVFALMLEFGLQPNIQIYTILVKNAIDDGDSETAWQIHDTMLENNVKPNEFTYSVLLNDAKLRKDWASVDHIMEMVKSSQIGDEHLITDLLHAIFLRHEQVVKSSVAGCQPPFPFRRMLDLYCEYFDSGPLKELLGPSRYQKHLPDPDPEKIHPSKYPLTVMCIAFLRGHTEKQMTLSWYQNFRKLLLKGHHDALALTESTYLYDTVIMSLGRTSTTTRLCTNVVRDMLNSYEKAQQVAVSSQELLASEDVYPDRLSPPPGSFKAASMPPIIEEMLDAEPHGENSIDNSGSGTNLQPNSAASTGSSPPHCQPSVRTWSILLKVFMDHDQPRAAEKVITMMNARGITPNQVTWNSLAIGYTRMQDIPGTVGTIERFEREGLKVDEWTMSGLQRIRKKTALIRAMDRKDELLGMESRPPKVRNTVEGLTREVSEVIKDAQRHFKPTKLRPTKISRHPPNRLGLDVDEFIFPSNERQP